MLYLFGDSHAHFSFKNLPQNYNDYHAKSVTMFRIGRDNTIVNLDKVSLHADDVVVLAYGEVDCRCHVQRQVDAGRDEDAVISALVRDYVETIKANLSPALKIIVVGVIPPTRQSDYESIHGPILHEFPFVGSDEARVRYTAKVNALLQELAAQNNWIYFNGYDYCTRPDGTLKHEMSDSTVHLRDNAPFLAKFVKFSCPCPPPH